MTRISSILIVYFVCTAVMFGAGLISLTDDEEAGIVSEVISADDDGFVNQEIIDRVDSMGGPIGNIIGTVGGGLVAFWNFITAFIDVMFWPVNVLLATGAPIEVVVLGGGTLVMAFIAGLLRTVRGSA